MRTSRFGQPMPRTRSSATVLVVEPTVGLVVDQPPTDIPIGATPASENFMMREGSLRPRPVLSQHTANANPLSIGVQSDIVVKHLDREVKDWTHHRKAMDEQRKQERLLSGFVE